MAQDLVSVPISFEAVNYYMVMGRYATHRTYGPFPTLERARQEAAMLLATQEGAVYDVFKCVGSVTKAVAPMTWTETPADS